MPRGFEIYEDYYPSGTGFFEIYYNGSKIGTAIKDGELWYTFRLPKRRTLIEVCRAIIKSELRQAEEDARMKKYLLEIMKDEK